MMLMFLISWIFSVIAATNISTSTRSSYLSTTFHAVVIEAATPASVESCLKRDRCPGHEQSAALTFTVPREDAESACRRYCRYAEGCASFALNLTSLRCSLFTDRFIYNEMRQGEFADCVAGVISCWIHHEPCLEILEEVAAQSILIRSPFDRCLKATEREQEVWELGKVRQVIWRGCYVKDRWRVTLLQSGNVRIKLSGTEQCLTWLKKKTQENQTLVVSQCVIGMPAQTFQIVDDFNYRCYFNLYKGAKGSIQGPLFSRHIELQNLGPLLLDLPIRFDSNWEGPCKMKQLRVGNGMVSNLGDRPFFLPGSTISVHCNKEHGVQGHSGYNTTCAPDLALKRCTRLPSRCHHCYVYRPLLVILSAILILVAIYMAARTTKQRSKEESHTNK